VELFHELCKALEVLSDPKAKAAYDAVLKAKEQARLRTQALDAKRKKFKQGKFLLINNSKTIIVKFPRHKIFNRKGESCISIIFTLLL